MPVTNGYADLPTLKSRLHLSQGDTEDDTLLEQLLTAVSRQIDDHTGHRYYATTATRVYTAWESGRLLLPRGHDLLSVTTLATDADNDRIYENVWATTDYDLEPANNPSLGRPYWAICVRYGGDFSFPYGVQAGVQVAGLWGWSATTPDVVREACLVQCELAYQNVNAAGQAMSGAGEYTQALVGIGLHPFVVRMLEPDRERGAW